MIAGVGGEFRRRVARRREQQQRRRDEVEQREVDALAAACPDVPRTRRTRRDRRQDALLLQRKRHAAGSGSETASGFAAGPKLGSILRP